MLKAAMAAAANPAAISRSRSTSVIWTLPSRDVLAASGDATVAVRRWNNDGPSTGLRRFQRLWPVTALLVSLTALVITLLR